MVYGVWLWLRVDDAGPRAGARMNLKPQLEFPFPGSLISTVLNLKQQARYTHEIEQRVYLRWSLGVGNVQRFRGGLVFKAHRLLYHSTLGLRVIKKEKALLDLVRLNKSSSLLLSSLELSDTKVYEP
jgi:hypothetical protein